MTRRFTRFLRRNTIAMLALFIALSGTTFAASNALAPNSVGARQLKKNAVTTKKIKKNAVTGIKVKNNSISGADVLESSLAKVPSATNADHATTADTATNATNATTATTATQLGGKSASDVVRWAVVAGNGTLARNSAGVVGSVRESAGVYVVEFDRSPQTCALSVTIANTTNSDPGAGAARVNQLAGAGFDNKVRVRITDFAGTFIDRPFHVFAFC